MKKILFVAFTFVCALVSAKSGKYPYQNPKLPVAQRVDDLLGRFPDQRK